jgi:hypothetical protein
VGAAPEEPENQPATPADELVETFEHWLVSDRGLAPAPVELYLRWSRHVTASWWCADPFEMVMLANF